MRRFTRNKRGISTVLATLMMIVIAVAGSLVTYAWTMGYLSFTTNKAGSAILIQSVSYSGTTLTAYVQNVGQAPITIDTAGGLYVNGVLQTYTGGQLLNQGQTATLLDSAAPSGLAGTKVIVKVVAHDGTFSEMSVYP